MSARSRTFFERWGDLSLLASILHPIRRLVRIAPSGAMPGVLSERSESKGDVLARASRNIGEEIIYADLPVSPITCPKLPRWST
jgi:hypothetical protein